MCAALTGNILSPSSFHPKLQNTPKHTTKSVPLGKPAVCSPAFPQPSQVPSHPLTPASRGTCVSVAWKENSEGCSTCSKQESWRTLSLERVAWQSCVNCASRQGPGAVTVPGNRPSSSHGHVGAEGSRQTLETRLCSSPPALQGAGGWGREEAARCWNC